MRRLAADAIFLAERWMLMSYEALVVLKIISPDLNEQQD